MTATAERRWTDRRGGRSPFHYPERRTGFDRRAAGRMTWYRDRPLAIAVVLAAVVVLNVLDLVFTNTVLARGGVEANPIMSALFEASSTAAAVFKLTVTGGVVVAIWRLRRYRRILEVSLVALVGYAALVGYQLTVVLAT